MELDVSPTKKDDRRKRRATEITWFEKQTFVKNSFSEKKSAPIVIFLALGHMF